MLGSRDPNAVGRYHAIGAATNLPRGPDFPVPVRQGIGLLGDVSQLMLEELPGRSAGRLTETPLTSLLDRADRRADLARPHLRQWRRQVVDTEPAGGGNCCQFEPLRCRSSETSHLPERPRSLVDARAGSEREPRELLRFDGNPLNVLVGGLRDQRRGRPAGLLCRRPRHRPSDSALRSLRCAGGARPAPPRGVGAGKRRRRHRLPLSPHPAPAGLLQPTPGRAHRTLLDAVGAGDRARPGAG